VFQQDFVNFLEKGVSFIGLENLFVAAGAGFD